MIFFLHLISSHDSSLRLYLCQLSCDRNIIVKEIMDTSELQKDTSNLFKTVSNEILRKKF